MKEEEAPYNLWKYGGIGWRFIAHVLDTIITSCIIATFIGVGFSLWGQHYLSEVLPQVLINAQQGNFDLSTIATHPFFITCLAVSFLFPILYGALFEGSALSATPGKLLLGLKVSSLTRHPILSGEAFARNILKNLPLLTTGITTILTLFFLSTSALIGGIFALILGLVPIAGFLFFIVDYSCALFSRERQAIHDSWSKTLVLSNPNARRGASLFLALVLIFALPATQAILMSKIGIQASKITQNMNIPVNLPQNLPAGIPEETSIKEIAQKAKALKDFIPSKILSPSERLKQALSQKHSQDIESTNPDQEKSTIQNVKKQQTAPSIKKKLVKSTHRKKTKSTVITESLRGAASINGKAFKILGSAAAIANDKNVLVLNLYDEPITNTSNTFSTLSRDTRPVIRLLLFLSSGSTSCKDTALEKYFIEVNAQKSGISYKKPFFSFKRSGSQILSNEYLDFSCKRSNPGWIKAELKGQTAFLLSGRRLPIKWSIDVIRKF